MISERYEIFGAIKATVCKTSLMLNRTDYNLTCR